MLNTLIIYEGRYGTSKKTAEIVAYILGNTKLCTVEKAPKNLEYYQNIIFVFGFYAYDTAKMIKSYVDVLKEQISIKKIGIIGVGISNFDFPKQLMDFATLLKRTEDISEFVEGELRINKLSQEDYNSIKMFSEKLGMPFKDCGNFKTENVIAVAEKFIKIMKTPNLKMPNNLLAKEMEKFIINHNTCALATGIGTFVRCTPIEYQYYKGNFYIITEGGMKFKGILQNKTVSMSIADNYKSMKDLKGLQISGLAIIVPSFSEEYFEVFKSKEIELGALEKLPIELYLIKVIPQKFEFLNADFKKNNFNSKQVLTC
ncbi:pyridoxamine 5'-phosphate oxidase family protein [Clostridium estertheticum]|uniref:pyridoxamine 5'-phosphate oxidase family protein n=1 Tax=Clostridium estertheticum TaxID=238834 RepID=UPI001C0AA16C|nr:pyridoxamine 5'-phosphate oxidase family protein [Clostridium estertheticum]MBU3216077.1 pyridoxamine 5'-phosphate oxidase family protein [Clostridium estertheticum]WAG55934.1 pyridoxamine 5'-phosphate oxidase family protein [Clostridium estertheticum]